VKKTFGGIINGFRKAKADGKLKHVRIWVRRGGPREKEGLDAMRALKDEGFDNLIRFLQEAKRERGKKEMEAFAQMKKKVEVVKPQLIIPGQSGPGGRFIPNPNPQS